ncbi:MAG: glycosyltransferase family 39 protein, partial [Myxococcales bacterium]|nr:glycosyltransferase family 39 protein [Myxococcales bacterium]
MGLLLDLRSTNPYTDCAAVFTLNRRFREPDNRIDMTSAIQRQPVSGEQPLPAFKPDVEKQHEWVVRAALVLVLALIWFPLMGAFGLWDPWETHYGEVGRQLLERGDWVSTWWGSHWRNGEGASEGTYFYSKPILLMWMMGLGMETLGHNSWGLRMGVALIAFTAAFSLYLMGREVWSRRTGVFMALVTATSPFFTMLGRQAQTDMPFVGLMTVSLAFLMMGIFGKRRKDKATAVDILMFLAFWLVLFIPQMQLIWVKFGDITETTPLFRKGWMMVIMYCLPVAIVLASLIFQKKKVTKGQVWLFAFYVFVALATLAKGILGFAVPGAIALIYLLVSREWWL